MSAYGGPAFQVVLAAVTDLWEEFVAPENTATEPDGIALDHILCDVDLDGLRGLLCEGQVLVETVIDSLLH